MTEINETPKEGTGSIILTMEDYVVKSDLRNTILKKEVFIELESSIVTLPFEGRYLLEN